MTQRSSFMDIWDRVMRHTSLVAGVPANRSSFSTKRNYVSSYKNGYRGNLYLKKDGPQRWVQPVEKRFVWWRFRQAAFQQAELKYHSWYPGSLVCGTELQIGYIALIEQTWRSVFRSGWLLISKHLPRKHECSTFVVRAMSKILAAHYLTLMTIETFPSSRIDSWRVLIYLS